MVNPSEQKISLREFLLLGAAVSGFMKLIQISEAAFPRAALEGRKAEMIKKVKEGYQVLSSKGKNLGGPYKTLEEAKKRLRQVEFFKHRKG